MPIDVNQLGCDILCATGRKFLRGPRGTGLLYVRQKILTTLDPPLLNHHAANLLSSRRYQLRPDARRFECWERSCAGQVALGRAIDYAREWGLEAIAARIGTLATSLRTELSQIPGITVTDQGLEVSPGGLYDGADGRLIGLHEGGQQLGQGREGARKALLEDPKLADTLVEKVREAWVAKKG